VYQVLKLTKPTFVFYREELQRLLVSEDLNSNTINVGETTSEKKVKSQACEFVREKKIALHFLVCHAAILWTQKLRKRAMLFAKTARYLNKIYKKI
jgi:hypothetical protein